MEGSLLIFVKAAKPGDDLIPQWSSHHMRQFPHMAAFVLSYMGTLLRFWTDLKDRSELPYTWAALIEKPEVIARFRVLKVGGPVAHTSQVLHASDYKVITVEEAEALLK